MILREYFKLVDIGRKKISEHGGATEPSVVVPGSEGTEMSKIKPISIQRR